MLVKMTAGFLPMKFVIEVSESQQFGDLLQLLGIATYGPIDHEVMLPFVRAFVPKDVDVLDRGRVFH